MQKRTSKALKSKNTGEDAVSPVVGVMLLLVVTVIIAAVVATFASGLVTTQQTVPTLAADVEIVSVDSYATTSGIGKFEMKVIAVSEDIPTKDLKLVTKYTTTNRTNPSEKISGGATVYGKTLNTQYQAIWWSSSSSQVKTTDYSYNSPVGYGAGVHGVAMNSGNFGENQHFGSYALKEGTYMQSVGGVSTIYPNGVKRDLKTTQDYIDASYEGDALDAVLGEEWIHLQPGDTVDVTLIHVPTNGVIYSNTVVIK